MGLITSASAMSDIINNYGALPIGGWLRITSATEIGYEGPVFNPAPGFEAENLRIHPGMDGLFDVMISVEEPSG